MKIISICFHFLCLWETSSASGSIEFLDQQAKNSNSAWIYFSKRFPFVFRFSTSLFWDIPGMFPWSVRTCGFKRNSSNSDRAPKMRDFVLLNSWDSFLVTLPLISSELYEMYSSVIPGTGVFCDWLLLGCSCVSLEITASFRLFLCVAMLSK